MLNELLRIENAKLMYRNFSGNPTRFSPPGIRSFSIVFDEEQAHRLSQDGWNIKVRKPRPNSDDDPVYHLPVAVSFSNPNLVPRLFLITSKNKTPLSEHSVSLLDSAELTSVDVVVRPYNWEVNGKKGVKAYLKAIYATIYEDEFDKKYRDIPDSGTYSEDEDLS